LIGLQEIDLGWPVLTPSTVVNTTLEPETPASKASSSTSARSTIELSWDDIRARPRRAGAATPKKHAWKYLAGLPKSSYYPELYPFFAYRSCPVPETIPPLPKPADGDFWQHSGQQRHRLRGRTDAVDTLGSSWPPEYGDDAFMFAVAGGAQSWVASPWPSSDEEASTPHQFQTNDDVDVFGLSAWRSDCESACEEMSPSVERQASPWPTASEEALLSDELPTTDGVDAFGLSLWPTAASDEEVLISAERTEPKQLEQKEQKEQKLAATTSICSVHSWSKLYYYLFKILLLLFVLFLLILLSLLAYCLKFFCFFFLLFYLLLFFFFVLLLLLCTDVIGVIE